MSDSMSKAQRSAHMAKIRGDDLKPEVRFRYALAWAGLVYDRNRQDLPGKPDVVVFPSGEGKGMAVFVHGCFWHCCPKHFRPVAGGRDEGWRRKFERNVRRDRRVREQLRRLGYRTAVVWEHEVKTDEDARVAAERIKRKVNRCSR